MKLPVEVILIMIFCNACFGQQKSLQTKSNPKDEKGIDKEFAFHFKVLDSVSKANIHDTVYACCSQSIKFFEEKTGIESSSSGTAFGRLIFFKNDLLKWHQWYDSLSSK